MTASVIGGNVQRPNAITISGKLVQATEPIEVPSAHFATVQVGTRDAVHANLL